MTRDQVPFGRTFATVTAAAFVAAMAMDTDLATNIHALVGAWSLYLLVVLVLQARREWRNGFR